jgi:hypothetical protein
VKRCPVPVHGHGIVFISGLAKSSFFRYHHIQRDVIDLVGKVDFSERISDA